MIDVGRNNVRLVVMRRLGFVLLLFALASRPTRADDWPRWRGSDGRGLSTESWKPEALDTLVRTFAEETGRKLGKVAQPLRAALTGKSTSPGIFDVLDVLGREESLARIRDQVQ